MKVFISADIEGIASTVLWDECIPGKPGYAEAANQMTKEVLAACQGAFNAGADQIYVKDAHSYGNNIDVYQMPPNVYLRRCWSEAPLAMVEGINETFDAALFVGYHSAAGMNGNFLSHTMNLRIEYIKINGILASEFMIFSYAAAYYHVPTIYLSGDKQLCETYASLHPQLVTTAVKEGDAFAAICMSPTQAVATIEKDVESALKQDLTNACINLPETFEVEIRYKDHSNSSKPSYYPGMERLDANTLRFKANDYMDVLTMMKFCL
ncbi:MAG: M55 family metallopeptidase [Lachnospiraceae bacterium]|nr:M55 family metallopeptidase [Lachnospiraceae bacterium]